MLLQINHSTHYRYDQPVDYALQRIRLRPCTAPGQDIVDWSVVVDGGGIVASYFDHYGNHTDLVRVEPGGQSVTLTASGRVTTHDTSGIFGKDYGRAPLWHFCQATSLTAPGPRIEKLSKLIDIENDTLASLHELSEAVLKAVPYQTGQTGSATPAEQALELGNGGVCQDHAQIFAAAARVAGVPARYVSGYLMMNDRVDQDASHAWAEVHLDNLGWVGFDVSNGIAPDARYVRVAVGRDAQDAAPVTGMRLGNSDESMIVSLQVQQ